MQASAPKPARRSGRFFRGVEQRAQILRSGGQFRHLGFSLRPVIARREIDGLLYLGASRAIQPVKSALTLAPGIASRNHPRDQRQIAIRGVKGVAGRQGSGQAGIDVRHEIEPHQVDEAEHTGFRDPHGLADDRIRLLDSQALLDGLDHPDLQPVDPEPIGDETRAVLAAHDALAENAVRKAGHSFCQMRIAVRARHDFQQTHVARRIEEVRDEKVTRERRGHSLRQQRQRNGGRVG